MNGHRRLCPEPGPVDPATVTLDDLIWDSPARGPSSFHVDVGPSLGRLGLVPLPNRDAVWFAVTAFLADRTVSRPKDWCREIDLTVPVSDVGCWQRVRDRLDRILGVLTSDTWRTTFEPAADVKGTTAARDADATLVCLLSGGADSLCGAVRALDEGHRPVLVSHWDWTHHKHCQKEVAAALRTLSGIKLDHVQVRLARAARQLGGARFPSEHTRRSRSLLFIALGLAVAAASGEKTLWIPENGFASLNPPLTPERMGSLSTRTTYPSLLAELRSVLRDAKAQAQFVNPFERLTKGEMLADLARRVGKKTAEGLLAKTHSCAHSRVAMEYGMPPQTQCGRCFGCLVRRSAFAASDLEDRSTYVDQSRPAFRESRIALSDLNAARYAVQQGIRLEHVLALDLPDDYSLDEAKSLCERGLAELRWVDSL